MSDSGLALMVSLGKQISGPPLSVAEHLKRCPPCAEFIDLRDRVWLEEHQQPLPHPPQDLAQ
jgi:hypothetical protein